MELLDIGALLLIPVGVVGLGFGLYKYFTSPSPTVIPNTNTDITVRALSETVNDLAETNITSLNTIAELISVDHGEQALQMIETTVNMNNAALRALNIILQGTSTNHVEALLINPRLIVFMGCICLFLGITVLGRD